MNKEIKKDLLEEGIQLLEEWVKRRNLLPNGTQLVVSMTIRDVEPVILQIEDQRSSSKVDEILARPLKDLQLGNRAHAILENVNFCIIGDVARFDEPSLLKYIGFGKRSLRDVKSKLENLGLKIGMHIPVGPLEREAVLRCPIERYAASDIVPELKARSFITVSDFLGKSCQEFVTIFKDVDTEEFGQPASVYGLLKMALKIRGVVQ